MKFILVGIAVAVALLIVATAKPTPEWKPPTDAEMSTQALICTFSNVHLPENEFLKCSLKCALENLGLFDETNGFNVENMVKAEMQEGFSESVARSMAEKCAVKKQVSETNCEWVSRGVDCSRAEEKSKRN